MTTTWTTRRAMAGFAVSIAMLVAATGCADDPTGYELYGDYPCLTVDPVVDGWYAMASNGLYAEMARQVPGGFGGMFYNTHPNSDRLGPLTIHLTDPSKKDEAFAVLAEEFDRRPQEVLKGDYDWLQLTACSQAMSEVIWDFDGITSADLDERMNRIVLGIEDIDAESELRDLIDGTVPQGILMVEEQGPIIWQP